MPNMLINAQDQTAFDPSRRSCLTVILSVLALPAVVPSLAFAGAYDDYFRAVRLDDLGELKSLLARGLDPNLVEPARGDSGLILALREGSMKVFAALLDARDIDLELKSRNGDNALMIAA